MRILTIGHSTRSFDTFVEVLEKHGVEAIVDVRRFPTSKRMPWFKREYLELMLPKHDIKYRWMGKRLGGYRKGDYSDYMERLPFKQGLEELNDFAVRQKTALMCAESAPHRCHRRYISDALVDQGWTVRHILDENRAEPHETQEVLS